MSVQQKFQQAIGLHQQGRFAEAERLYEQVLAHAPVHFDALHMLGVIALQTGRADRGAQMIEKAIKVNPKIAVAFRNLGIALQNLGRLDDAVARFDNAIALQPEFFEAHVNRGNALQALKRFDDAVSSYDRALALRPESAEIHHNRANALRPLGRLDEAIAGYDKAIALKADFAEAHINRGSSLADLKRFGEAVASFDEAIALRPDLPEGHGNRGNALHQLGRLDEAIVGCDAAIALRPDYADAHMSKSHILLVTGQFDQGWRAYEWRKATVEPTGNRSCPQPLWDGSESIESKSIFLHWEQGFGDTIQFSRYAGLLADRGARVALSVQDPLVRLFKQWEPRIEIIGGDRAPVSFDFHCPLMSLPYMLKTGLETVPAYPSYLAADPSLTGPWAARLAPKAKPRIGLAWRGNANHKNDHNRSVDLDRLAPLLAFDADWVSLQKEMPKEDAAKLGRVADLSGEIGDFADTAALIAQLDLVISVDTSIAHLAAAMGKPTWILLPFNPDWRWLTDRDDSPWYPSVRLFRQPQIDDWSPVIERIGRELAGSDG
jgi:tetratricopeptide (TPR) repeat protein